MTSSQWLDLAVLAVAFVAAISGWRSGALGSLLAFVGVVLGAVAGVLLAPHVVSHISGPRTKLFVTLFLILALVVIGEIAGVVLGRAVRGAIRNRALRTFDSVIGVGLQLVAVLVAAWLLGTLLTSSDQPNLAAAVRGSKVLAQVDEVAPSWLRSVPNRLSALWDTSGLPDVLPPFGRTPIVNVDAPDAALASDAVVAATRPSVVKIRGVAPGCQKVLEGSGFVVAPNRVMSNAHVVAGSDSVTVEVDGETYDASVVSYDPNADISILDVPEPAGAAAAVRRDAGPDGHRRHGDGLSRRRRLRRHPGPGARDHRAQRARHLPHHDRHPRGVHDQGDCAARKFGRSDDQSQRQGARRGVRRRRRRRRHRVRADRRRGVASAGQDR